MTGKKSTVGICVYCGRERLLTDDHVPPQCLFGKPRPPDLISVPACESCNSKKYSMDDEYFRACLALWERTKDHPTVKKILPSVLRSYKHPKKRRTKQALANSLRRVVARSGDGLWLPKVGFQVDHERMGRTAERIVRGLFYHEVRKRLPSDCTVWARSLSALNMTADTMAFVEKTMRPVLASPPHVISNGDFAYFVAADRAVELCSAWVLCFYKAALFLGVTIPARIEHAG